MAKPNKRQAKTDQKIKCEYSGCTTMFARDSDRRRHGKEQHGPLLHCSYPNCEFTTRRMSRLGTHLNNTHHHQGTSNLNSDLALYSSSLTLLPVNINLTIPFEFRNANAQTLASPNHREQLHTRPRSLPQCLLRFINRHLVSALEPNTSSNFDPTTPLISIDYAISPQGPPEVFKPQAALQSEGASISEYNRPLGLLAAARARTQVSQHRIFKRCRVIRRRKPRPITHTSSAAPSYSHLDSAMQATPAFYSSGQENPNGFTQWMSHTVNAESFANVLDSLSLRDSKIAVTASTGQQLTSNTNSRRIEPFGLNHNAACRSDTGGWDMIVE